MKGNGLLLRVALRPLRLCVKAGLTSVAAWRLCVNCRFQFHTPRRFGRYACARWPAAMSFLAEASWLWWSLGVALAEPWGGFGGALGWLWWSLGVALGWLCTPESMPSIWLWCGLGVALGWLWVVLAGLSAFCLLPSLGGRHFHLTGARVAEQPIGSEVRPEPGRFFPGATRTVVPKPTDEAKFRNLRHVAPKTLQKALYVGCSESAQPLQVAYFAWPRFPVPGSAPRMGPGPQSKG